VDGGWLGHELQNKNNNSRFRVHGTVNGTSNGRGLEMPQFNCTACGAGLYSAAAADDLIDPRCPTCGSGSHRVRAPERRARLRGARNASHHSVTTRTYNAGHQRIVDRFAEFMARGRPDEVARLDAERWLGDGGSFSSAVVARARPAPTAG